MTDESALGPVEDPRPERLALLAVVAGIATDVGKTWVTAAVAMQLQRAGTVVAARKPAQSHESGDAKTDAPVLARSTSAGLHAVCRADRGYPAAMAPPMAAAALDAAPFAVADLVAELEWPTGCDVDLIESTGGIRPPLASDGDTVELIRQVDPDAVVLGPDAGLGVIDAVRPSRACGRARRCRTPDARLGVIDAVRLCLAALEPIHPIVLLNRFDSRNDLHRRNLAWLSGIDGRDPLKRPEHFAHLLAGLGEDLR